ncbi:hypothetical protein [Streptomyces sp. NPDC127197]|uniref:hypothetical protein n=1 Tax=Streptomyces sp. NPDC127197 TaxID=3345388 RepID=UPI00362A90BD
MPGPAVAVVAPLAGPLTAAGAVLLAEVDRIRTVAPDAAEWHVHHEAPGIGDTVAAGAYAAVVGHADPVVADGALPAYERAGLASLLPFVRGRSPAVTWAPDDARLAGALHDSALALGATALTVTYAESEDAPAETLAELARRSGLTVAVEKAGPGPIAGHREAVGSGGDVLVLLVPQHRLAPMLRALSRAGGAGRYRAVLVVADCGLPSFTALAEAARGLPVWAVHPELCLVRRARVAVVALAAALAERPALRGPRLAADVAARSAHLLGADGGVLGEGRRVSRLSAVCPVRAAAGEDVTGLLPLAPATLTA